MPEDNGAVISTEVLQAEPGEGPGLFGAQPEYVAAAAPGTQVVEPDPVTAEPSGEPEPMAEPVAEPSPEPEPATENHNSVYGVTGTN